jgi:3-hydroxyacyl-CoA dehydrogenase
VSGDLREQAQVSIERAAVIGAGTMGSGIAICFANAGIAVTLIDASPEALERGGSGIDAAYAGAAGKGRLSAAEAALRRARIVSATDIERARDADIAIEAVFEALDLKRDVFARLGAALRPDALLATNTSTLNIDAIAAAAPHPERTLGMHFFSPAHVMRLLEIVRGERTSAATLDAALRLGKRLGKVPVVVGNCDGFVGNRMLLHYRRAAEFTVLAGASPADVDAALERFGMAMGPFAVADLAGIDIGLSSKRERIKRGAAPPFRVTDFPDKLVAAGRLGQKARKGWYRYAPGDRTRHPDPEVDAIVASERAAFGFSTRDVPESEIVARCMAALVNEGARILDEGIAASAADIDLIWVNGYGFPAARGGPMRYAEETGLPEIVAAIRGFARDDPEFWKPAPLLERTAAAGAGFP